MHLCAKDQKNFVVLHGYLPDENQTKSNAKFQSKANPNKVEVANDQRDVETKTKETKDE